MCIVTLTVDRYNCVSIFPATEQCQLKDPALPNVHCKFNNKFMAYKLCTCMQRRVLCRTLVSHFRRHVATTAMWIIKIFMVSFFPALWTLAMIDIRFL